MFGPLDQEAGYLKTIGIMLVRTGHRLPISLRVQLSVAAFETLKTHNALSIQILS